MDLGAGSKCLDPGVNVYSRPDPFPPVHIFSQKLLHNAESFGFKNPEHMGAPFCWPQRDQDSILLKGFQPS